MPVAFPRELYDEVLSHISEDSTALQNAALVCRSWTDPSQTVLFASVDLKVDYDDQQPETRPSNLLRSLISAPHLAAYIRTLSIVLRSTRRGAPVFPGKANAIATILPHLSHISSLSLHADHMDKQMIAAMGAMALNSPLSAIDLPYAVFSSFRNLTRVLPRNLCLRSLKIGRLIIKDKKAPPSIEAPAVHSLTFDRCVTALPRLAAWMFARPITVHDFHQVDCGGQSPTVVAILKAIAPSVVKLDLDLMGGVPPTEIVFPELRSVTYRLDTASITPPRLASDHLAFLTTFEAPNLEEVILCFHQYHPNLRTTAIDFASLRRIDEHLGHVTKFPNLRKFHVELTFPCLFIPPEREEFWKESRRQDSDMVPAMKQLFDLGSTRDSLEHYITTSIARKLVYTSPLPPLPARVPVDSETEDERKQDSTDFFLSLYPEFSNILARGVWSASLCSWLGTTRRTWTVPTS
ncbi:hypothetical protein C8R46DRAFT_1352765 [Mycena filopes]|nr:hypothetical protein C8R46DRAFT_1352765 [Mycena filopes]